MRYGYEDNFQICVVLFTPYWMFLSNQYDDDDIVIIGYWPGKDNSFQNPEETQPLAEGRLGWLLEIKSR